ncbi:hypothetical protein GGI35DRAFT_375969 [Trichoderma velutinum]
MQKHRRASDDSGMLNPLWRVSEAATLHIAMPGRLLHHVEHEHVSRSLHSILHCQRVNAAPAGCRNNGPVASRRSRTTQEAATRRQCHSTHAYADQGTLGGTTGDASSKVHVSTQLVLQPQSWWAAVVARSFSTWYLSKRLAGS